MTKLNNQNLVSAVRTVGQLLLHRPTIGCLARNSKNQEVDILSPKACKFCYNGAIRLVSRKVFVNYSLLDRKCDDIVAGPESFVDGYDWDRATSSTRKRWAQKLADYTGE